MKKQKMQTKEKVVHWITGIVMVWGFLDAGLINNSADTIYQQTYALLSVIKTIGFGIFLQLLNLVLKTRK